MVFLSTDRKGLAVARFARPFSTPNLADFAILAMIGAAAVLVVHGIRDMNRPLAQLQSHPVTLELARLPGYAIDTTLRMFAAIICSLIFTFVVGSLAAKSRKAALVVVPALDVLQSVPVLGFLTFTFVFFLNLFPGSELGAECASIFLVFTAQAWNMTFSFYQSLRTLPADLEQASRQFGLSPWLKFIRLELPFAMPGLIWNTMMSMSGGWFFVVASEAFTVGSRNVALPGIGSWLAVAEDQQNFGAVAWAVLAMAVVIALYDQLLFRPIVAWADKFRFEQTASEDQPQSWVYDLLRRTRAVRALTTPLAFAGRAISAMPLPRLNLHAPPPSPTVARWLDRLWLGAVVAIAAVLAIYAVSILSRTLELKDALAVAGLGFLTLVRVMVLIAIASLIWVPIGVWIGLRPAWTERVQPLAQFLAAFPVNVLFPVVAVVFVLLRPNADIWLSPLMVLGTQWYILFNVIAGASAIPTDLKEAGKIFGVRSWQWWRQIGLPGIFPYYVTGAITASGGSWNASIVAESVTWGHTHLTAKGLGSFIADATAAGDLPRVGLGVAVMSLFVITLNRTLWRPLYGLAERRLRLD
jgi:NitT/TauT family transport system permease protein